MRQPKLNDLTIDPAGTRKLRSQLTKSKKIKITINIDEQSLTFCEKSPVNRLLHICGCSIKFLRKGQPMRVETKARLDRIERELEKLKRQIAA